MATQTETPNEEVKVQVSAKLSACVLACVKADVQKEIALDSYRNTAKSEAVRLSLTDRKALTAVLFASGDQDARRVSEIVGFVFPASTTARKELDAAMEQNAKQTDPKKRIAKQVILDLQRDKTGKLTLEAAQAAHKATKSGRTPGGKVDPTEKKKLTPKEIEEQLGNLLSAALNFAKKHEYDSSDVAALLDEHGSKIYGETWECSIEVTEKEEEAQD